MSSDKSGENRPHPTHRPACSLLSGGSSRLARFPAAAHVLTTPSGRSSSAGTRLFCKGLKRRSALLSNASSACLKTSGCTNTAKFYSLCPHLRGGKRACSMQCGVGPSAEDSRAQLPLSRRSSGLELLCKRRERREVRLHLGRARKTMRTFEAFGALRLAFCFLGKRTGRRFPMGVSDSQRFTSHTFGCLCGICHGVRIHGGGPSLRLPTRLRGRSRSAGSLASTPCSSCPRLPPCASLQWSPAARLTGQRAARAGVPRGGARGDRGQQLRRSDRRTSAQRAL